MLMASVRNKARSGKSESNRVARGLLGIAAIMERVARPALGKRGFAAGQIIGRWDEIVGRDLATVSVPDKIHFERGHNSNGTLYLRVASGAAATLIQPQASAIIERVNTFLGPGTIKRIKVSQGPLATIKTTRTWPEPPPLSEESIAAAEREISVPESTPLRKALARLGARIKTRC